MNTAASPTSSLPRPSQAREALSLKPAGSDAATDAMAQLIAALASDRPIGYSANLARVAGDAKAGLLLSQLMYWTRVGVDVESQDGWISKSREQWTLETGLSRCEQESARIALLGAGLIEEARVGMPARLAFRVCLPTVSTALARLLNSEPVQWSLFDVRSNANQVRALLGRNMAFYRVYTEITGSISQAIFMARAMHAQRALTGSGAHSDWFTFSPAGWSGETGLTAAQLRNSKQKLCQSSHLEQAMVQYPKRRTVLRLRLTELTTAIVALRLKRMNDGKAVGGLLGAMGRTSNPAAVELPFKVAIPQSHPSGKTSRLAKSHHQEKSTPLPSDSGVRQKGEVYHTDTLRQNGGHGQNWLLLRAHVALPQPENSTTVLSDGDVRQKGEMYQRDTLRQNGELSTELKRNSAQNSNFADSADLVSDFSQVDDRIRSGKQHFSLPTCEISQASSDRSDGGFSYSSRQVLAALHAGARFLTTKDKTTTPPTPSPAPSIADKAGLPASGGGGLFKSSFGQFRLTAGGTGAISATAGSSVTTTSAAPAAPAVDAPPRPVASPVPPVPPASNPTSAEPAQLIWPDLLPAQLLAVQRMVREHRVACSLDLSRMQLLLDELASVASRGQLRVATAYLSNLLIKESAGTLDLSAAYEWQARREMATVRLTKAAAASSTGLPEKTSQQGPGQRRTSVPVLPAAPSSARTQSHPADPVAQATWNHCLALLQPRIGLQHVQLWLNPLIPAAITQTQLVLVCPSRFKLDHIKAAYLPEMNEVLAQLMNAEAHRQVAASTWTCHLTTSYQPSVQAR